MDIRKYRAFISYSSTDRKWARWLHKRIENYPIPKDLRDEKLSGGGIRGKYVRPVFRDRDELAGSSDLGTSIITALKQSEFLIVLCSKNSAKSLWVENEIQEFKSLGRSNRILPLIIDGEPNAKCDSNEECFPPSLRLPLQPLAGDFRKRGDGKQRAFLKVFAAITELNFDELYNRHQKSRKKRTILTTVVAWSIITLLLFLSLFAFRQKNEAEFSERLSASNFAALAIEKSATLQWEGNHTQARHHLRKVDSRFRNWPWYFLVARAGPTPKNLIDTQYLKESGIRARLIPDFPPSSSTSISSIDRAIPPISNLDINSLDFNDRVEEVVREMWRENLTEAPIFETTPPTRVIFNPELSSNRLGPSGIISRSTATIHPITAVWANSYSQIDCLMPHRDVTTYFVSTPNGCLNPKRDWISSGLSQDVAYDIFFLKSNSIFSELKNSMDQRAFLFSLIGKPCGERNIQPSDEIIFYDLNSFVVRLGKEIRCVKITSAMNASFVEPPQNLVNYQKVNDEWAGRISEKIANQKHGLVWSTLDNRYQMSEMVEIETGKVVAQGFPMEFPPYAPASEYPGIVMENLECADWVLGCDWFISTHWNQIKSISIFDRFGGKLLASINLPRGIGWPENIRRSRQRPQLSPDGKYLYVHCSIIDTTTFEVVFSMPFGTGISPDWNWVVEPLGSNAVYVHDLRFYISNYISNLENFTPTSRDRMILDSFKIGRNKSHKESIFSNEEIDQWLLERVIRSRIIK